MKQVSILNKQLALLRANQVPNPQAAQTLPLENITNILNSASSLLPQTSTSTSSNKENAPKAPNTGAKRGAKPLPRDRVTDAIIRPRDEEENLNVKTRKSRNKENGQKILNFLFNIYLIHFNFYNIYLMHFFLKLRYLVKFVIYRHKILK